MKNCEILLMINIMMNTQKNYIKIIPSPTSQVKIILNSYEMKNSYKKKQTIGKNAIREIYKTFVK